MVKAHFQGGIIVLGGTRFKDEDGCHQLPGSRYKDGVWHLPITWAAIKVMRSIWPDIELDQGIIDWTWTEYHSRVGPAMNWRAHALNPDEGTYTPVNGLWPFQQTGASFLAKARGVTLADDMGGGKTAQAICALEIASAYPALIVCPATAKINWQREFEKWAPKRTVQVISGTATQRRKCIGASADVWVVGLEALRTHSRLAPYGSTRLTDEEKRNKELNQIEWAAVVVDEAHRAVDPHAKQTRAIWGVSQNSSLRFALTGTPIVNSPQDLWALLHYEAPLEWPSKTKYLDRYCLVQPNRWGGIEVNGLNPYNADEFFSLVEPRLLRRPKSLILPWLPPKVYERRDIEMHPAQRKAYDSFKKDSMALLDGGVSVAKNPLEKLQRLTQLAAASLELDGTPRMTTPSSKVEALIELLQDMGNEPLVVFAHSRQLIELCEERLEKERISYAAIKGNQTELIRQYSIDSFQGGQVRVMLCTLGAGSEAITLTAASTVCFLQRSWSMVTNRQAEDRVHRPGQEASSVTVIDLFTIDTVEEHIYQVVQDKGVMSEEVLRDSTVLQRILG